MMCVFLLALSYSVIRITSFIRDYLYGTSVTYVESADVPDAELKESEDSEDFPYTEEEMSRVTDFELRIARMKDELAQKTVPIYSEPRKGTVAEIYHPDVQNLDHNIISNYTALPDVEIAD